MRISLRVLPAAIVSIAALFTSNHISAQTNCAPVPAGLVGWWASEGNVNDSTGEINDLPEGGASFTVAITTNAASTAGSSQAGKSQPDSTHQEL